MPDYAFAKLYRVEMEDGFYYYGSTCSPLPVRLAEHQRHAKRKPDLKRHSKPILGITLVREVPCSSRSELRAMENALIEPALDDPKCLNAYRAVANPERKKDYIRDYGKAYYEAHRDEVLARQRDAYAMRPKAVSVVCEVCGGRYTPNNKRHHLQTQKHLTRA